MAESTDVTYLRAQLKVAERQNEIDALKISHLVNRINGLATCDDRNDLLRTIKRLNAANTSLNDHNAELTNELEQARGRIAELQERLASS